ncbi:MAG: FAD-dependent monooxygenase [Actinomycetota bacterium]|nr:FAD-dependent monooxygenase [Actinomycetota bacterium]
MQLYLDGYTPGDPLGGDRRPASLDGAGGVPDEVDVLVVGAGPAGMVLAAQLARFPDLTTALVEQADGPLLIGQADGVACRTVEMLEAFGLVDRLLPEAYWVNEVAFWSPDPADPTRIVRTGRVRDTDEDTSELPHVTVNQARLLAFLRDDMERSPTGLRPAYGLQLHHLQVDPSASHPVRAVLAHVKDLEPTGDHTVVRARYAVGCDGARSAVRQAIGRQLVGDRTDTSWGVMDLLAVTDFPDIRLKTIIKSANGGNLIVIPREGGYLVRLYIELDPATDRQAVQDRSVTTDQLLAVANRIFHPYTIEARQIGWWSVYDIGQRLCDRFDDLTPDEVAAGRPPRVLIAGDACHTHSAKAGQGMNVSMADGWNLGWKLAAVLRGQARPDLLLTYSDERQAVAQELIDFDREFARAMSAPPTPDASPQQAAAEADAFQGYFAQQLAYTAGTATRYRPSILTGPPTFQHLAGGFPVGMRFHSAPVVRLADAKQVQLGHVARADGAWRLYLFADHHPPESPSSRCRALCEQLASAASPLRRFTPPGALPDAVIDLRAIWQQPHHQVALASLPDILLPRKGRFGLIDYEKVFCPLPGDADIFAARSISRDHGCAVVVRPDQFVAHVLPLDAFDHLVDLFAGIFLEPGPASGRPPGA